MAKKIYVGNISWGTNDQLLREDFESFGMITEAKVITDRETGRSKGFGFVTFETDDAALKAIEEMDGRDVAGRTIRVSIAQDKPRQARQGFGGGDRYQSNRNNGFDQGY